MCMLHKGYPAGGLACEGYPTEDSCDARCDFEWIEMQVDLAGWEAATWHNGLSTPSPS